MLGVAAKNPRGQRTPSPRISRPDPETRGLGFHVYLRQECLLLPKSKNGANRVHQNIATRFNNCYSKRKTDRPIVSMRESKANICERQDSINEENTSALWVIIRNIYHFFPIYPEVYAQFQCDLIW